MENNFDELSDLKNLGYFLKIDVETRSGIVDLTFKVNSGKWETKPSQGHTIKIIITNTAPTEPKSPSVVFTGIGILNLGRQIYWGSPGTERFKNHVKVDLSNAPQVSTTPLNRLDGGTSFPLITSDELKHGYVLFQDVL
jgi:hypothetical protein